MHLQAQERAWFKPLQTQQKRLHSSCLHHLLLAQPVKYRTYEEVQMLHLTDKIKMQYREPHSPPTQVCKEKTAYNFMLEQFFRNKVAPSPTSIRKGCMRICTIYNLFQGPVSCDWAVQPTFVLCHVNKGSIMLVEGVAISIWLPNAHATEDTSSDIEWGKCTGQALNNSHF